MGCGVSSNQRIDLFGTGGETTGEEKSAQEQFDELNRAGQQLWQAMLETEVGKLVVRLVEWLAKILSAVEGG